MAATITSAIYGVLGVLAIAFVKINAPSGESMVIYGWSAGLAVLLTNTIITAIKERK